MAHTEAPFVVTPHLLRLLRERPAETRRILRNPDTGELRAFINPNATDQRFWMAGGVWRSNEWRYDDSRWMESRNLSSPDELVNSYHWFDIPLAWAVTAAPGFTEMMAAKPALTAAVWADPRDGELRAYTVHDWGSTAQSGFQVWPTVRTSLNRTYGGDNTWSDARFGLVSRQEIETAGFVKIWEADDSPTVVDPEVARLQALIVTLEASVASLRTQNDTQRRHIENLVEEHERFKKVVVSTADRYARRHDWCSVVNEALEEMGLEREQVSFNATVNIRVGFSGTRNDGEQTVPSIRELMSWMYGEDDIAEHIRETLGLNDDYVDEIEIDSIDFNVVSTESA
jgi:hypothetical protein